MTREKVCQNALMTILSPKAPLPLFMDWKLPGGKIVRLITDQAAARGITADYPDPATHPNP
jgi:hypothetical protein